ncbi:LOW QUALITY PROTEIN: splicing factor YJU2 [Drosophila ficusphila]|uniref:LOW QUALITY PROTEIN: splicing factor YJU2 n=1 Tax=Drosophila ficusphila TaxID=30025 RepID=UPI0007E80FF1|nr:LOW QUALITY PROTEIN: splicing factor YJU2 [Drosophila ficusphila]
MSERKVLNKYYPPDFDPSKIPRMKLAKNRQYTVRLMAPFNMRCKTCGEYIYKGKKFNARKEDVENETYLGIRIYRFYIKCTRCLQEISFKTDPQNTDYEIEAGATRNFMALKLAEEQARREEQELREEEANNPMKLLENRTQQSRNEIEMLESLEELRDLNRRQQTVDYTTLLQQYNTVETERERLEREEREDEDFIKSVNFKNKSEGGSRVVAEEIIEEVKEEPVDLLPAPPPAKQSKPSTLSVSASSSSKLTTSQSLVKRKTPLVLVKPKATTAATTNEPATTSATAPSVSAATKAPNPPATAPAGLSLLAAYSDSSEDSN